MHGNLLIGYYGSVIGWSKSGDDPPFKPVWDLKTIQSLE